MPSNLQKVTIYSRFEFMGNIVSVEGYLVSLTFRDSDGRKIPVVTYIKKRARTNSVIRVSASNPFLVIVEGWDRLQPAGLYDDQGAARKAEFINSRYPAFDPRWTSDFIESLEKQKDHVILHKSGNFFESASAPSNEAESLKVPADDAGDDRVPAETKSSKEDGDGIRQAIQNLRAAKSENFDSRNELRSTRYSELAESNQEKSEQLYARARHMNSFIPFAQPIQVGHYSEKSDRNYRDRIHNTYGKSFEAQKRAEYYSDKASSVGGLGVSSSDGEAINKLEAELLQREKTQLWMKKANAAIKRLLKKNKLSVEALKHEIPGFPEVMYTEAGTPDARGRYGYRHFEFTNNGANIRRLKDRIKELKAKEVREAAVLTATGEMFKEKSFGQITVTENFELNRIQIRFPRQEGKKAYSLMRSCGFVWSGTNKAYQRLLNIAGRNKAGFAVDKLTSLYPELARAQEASGQLDSPSPVVSSATPSAETEIALIP